MAFLRSLDISASGMTAQRMRLDIVSENITNRDTTRTAAGGPYRKKSVVFQNILASSAAERGGTKGGVLVSQIVEDTVTPMNLVYNPAHPDANADGYVEMPNVDNLKETIDAMSASQSYSANLTAFNIMKQMATKGLDIGK
ncbi:MAG: flagellar basal body rod protein FlgC [Hungatella sp.]